MVRGTHAKQPLRICATIVASIQHGRSLPREFHWRLKSYSCKMRGPREKLAYSIVCDDEPKGLAKIGAGNDVADSTARQKADDHGAMLVQELLPPGCP